MTRVLDTSLLITWRSVNLFDADFICDMMTWFMMELAKYNDAI